MSRTARLGMALVVSNIIVPRSAQPVLAAGEGSRHARQRAASRTDFGPFRKLQAPRVQRARPRNLIHVWQEDASYAADSPIRDGVIDRIEFLPNACVAELANGSKVVLEREALHCRRNRF